MLFCSFRHHFDVCAYLTVNIHSTLLCGHDNYSLKTPLHLEWSFHLKLCLKQFQPLSLLVYVAACMCRFIHDCWRQSKCQAFFFLPACSSFEDNSSLSSKSCFFFWTQIFSSATMCGFDLLWLAEVMFFKRWAILSSN